MTGVFHSFVFAERKLGRLVRSAWAQAYDAGASPLPGLIAPDAQVELVFQLGAPCALRVGEVQMETPRALLFGLRHGVLRLQPTGANRMVALRLPPAVATVVLRTNLADCWDRPLDLKDVIGEAADLLVDRLERRPLSEAGEVLESWLLSRLSGWDGDHERQAALQSAVLWDSQERRVAAVADDFGLTARTLRRRCAAWAGLSPKQLAMSGRMLRVCHALRSQRPPPLAQVAYAASFTDQAALANTVRHYFGLTPRQLRDEPLVLYEPPAPL